MEDEENTSDEDTAEEEGTVDLDSVTSDEEDLISEISDIEADNEDAIAGTTGVSVDIAATKALSATYQTTVVPRTKQKSRVIISGEDWNSDEELVGIENEVRALSRSSSYSSL